MPSSERVSAGEAAAAARERRDVARREEGKERDAGLGFAVPRWSKRSGSWDVVEETAMAEEGGKRGWGAVGVCRGFWKASASLSRCIIRFGGKFALEPLKLC